MDKTSFVVILMVLLFFIINISVLRSKYIKPQTIEDYAVAGRSLNWVLAAFSYIGAWYVGAIYTDWFATAVHYGVFALYLACYALGSLLILYIIAKPVWTMGKEHNLLTIADFIGLRYQNRYFRLFFALFTFAFWFPWLIIELKAVGFTLAVATHGLINFDLGVTVVAIFVIIYCYYGGARACAVGSLTQAAFFICFGAGLIYLLIKEAYGGIIPLYEMVSAQKPELLELQSSWNGKLFISSALTGTLGVFCWPDQFSQLYRAESPRAMRRTLLIGPLAVIAAAFLPLMLGLGASLLPGFPADTNSGIFWLAEHFAGPLGLAIMTVTVVAACISTIASIINAAAIIITNDLRLSEDSLSQETMLKNAKAATIVVGLLSLWLATIELPKLIEIEFIIYNCIVQATVPLLLGLYWKKGNVVGAVVGMLVGSITVIYGVFYPNAFGWSNGWSGGMIGLIFNFSLYILLSYLWPAIRPLNL